MKVNGLAATFLAYTKEGISKLLSNELSHGDTKSTIQKMVDSMDARKQDGTPTALHYVVDVFGDHFIYMKETPNGNQLFSQGYEVDGNDKLNLKGNAEEVKRKVDYVPLSANNLITEEVKVMAEVKKCCPKKVAEFIAANTNPYTEADKEMLEGLSEDQFTRISTVNYQKEVEKIVEKEVPANNAAPKTVDEIVANAPESMKEVLSSGVKLHAEKKDGIVKAILANELNKFTEDELKGKTLGELEKLASLSNVADYSGRGIAESVQANAAEGVEVLDLPTFVVNKKEDKK